jgi:hypothetical protein
MGARIIRARAIHLPVMKRAPRMISMIPMRSYIYPVVIKADMKRPAPGGTTGVGIKGMNLLIPKARKINPRKMRLIKSRIFIIYLS